MPTPLSPRWKPLKFATAPGTPFFDPVIVHERGLLIAGGPLALTVFVIGDRQSILFTIAAHRDSQITGFTVSAGSLYVQDGPVLLGFDLTYARPFAGINLVTNACWPELDDDEAPPLPPDSLWSLSEADSALQAALVVARNAHANVLRSGQLRGGDLALRASLDAAERNAEKIVFSAPVVRALQFEARTGNQIFSLRMDGKVHSIDDALRDVETFSAARPLRPELAMAELPQHAGDIRCHLYYMSHDGGIVAINATGDLTLLPGWAATGTIDRERVLPLRYVDGALMGGGILGHGFFAMPLDPAKPVTVSVPAPDGGWRQYDVAVAEKLVVVTNGLKSRLVSYAGNAQVRDRWRERQSSTIPFQSFVLFWAGTGKDAVVPGPKLVLEIPTAGPSSTVHLPIRTALANTVDAPDAAFSTDFPPQSVTVLDEVTLESGAFGNLPRIASLPCRPFVAQQTLYCIVRSTPQAAADGFHALVAYSLAARLSAILPRAQSELLSLAKLVVPIDIHVARVERTERTWPEPPITWDDGPFDHRNARVTLTCNNPAREYETTTDDRGIIRVDSGLAGREVTLNAGKLGLRADYVSCNSTTLVLGALNQLRILTFRSVMKG